MKPCIVISGVNLVEMGPLAIYRSALQSLFNVCTGRYDIVALVHKREILNVSGVDYQEYPGVKSSWLKRLYFEYCESSRISDKLRPELWVSMHDITPRVNGIRQVVYCHNPAAFYRFRIGEALLDPKHGLFTLLYKTLYRINLRRNYAVVVQQEWMRDAMHRIDKDANVIVANPQSHVGNYSFPIVEKISNTSSDKIYRFLYPAYPRIFKNYELLLRAAVILESKGISGYELIITVDAKCNRYGRSLHRKYCKLKNVIWKGILTPGQIWKLYGEVDCLVFPSKLETWGLPLTEFKLTGKPILAVDLPYAHETIGSYDQVKFFDANDADLLASQMQAAICGRIHWQPVVASKNKAPYAKDWEALWELLLNGNEQRAAPTINTVDNSADIPMEGRDV